MSVKTQKGAPEGCSHAQQRGLAVVGQGAQIRAADEQGSCSDVHTAPGNLQGVQAGRFAGERAVKAPSFPAGWQVLQVEALQLRAALQQPVEEATAHAGQVAEMQ